MGITKKINFKDIFSLPNIFLFLFFIVFPFGQIVRLSFDFAGLNIPLQPLDIIVGLAAIYTLIFQRNKSKALKYVGFFLSVAAFSFILSIFVFKTEVIYGSFYLVRLSAYLIFLNYVWNFVRKLKTNRNLLLNCLLASSVISAIFGWLQFFFFPDIKPFFVYGWDMHLFRLVGTFLDPTFLGIIIVFGLLLSIHRWIGARNLKNIIITIFLLVSLAFTYSRASYLAFIAGVLVISFAQKKFRKIFYWIAGLLILVVLLPTAKNHSIELTRIFSVTAKLTNYKETLVVFTKSPMFGVGYDNLCVARNKYVGTESFASHACSGSDSSLLFVLATTGVIGLMVFMGGIKNIYQMLNKEGSRQIIIASGVALLVHSLFSNSMFFPWVMGYMIILLGVSLKE